MNRKEIERQDTERRRFTDQQTGRPEREKREWDFLSADVRPDDDEEDDYW